MQQMVIFALFLSTILFLGCISNPQSNVPTAAPANYSQQPQIIQPTIFAPTETPTPTVDPRLAARQAAEALSKEVSNELNSIRSDLNEVYQSFG